MGTRYVVTCDKCNQEWDRGLEATPKVLSLALVTSWDAGQNLDGSRISGDSRSQHFRQDWCRPCVESVLGVFKQKPKQEPAAQVPSAAEELESIIRAIARDEAQLFIEGS